MTSEDVTFSGRQLNWVVHSLMVARIHLTADTRTNKDALLVKIRNARKALSDVETFVNNKYLGRETSNTGKFND